MRSNSQKTPINIWLNTATGRKLLVRERHEISRFLPSIYGYHGLELTPSNCQNKLIHSSQIMSPICLSTDGKQLFGDIKGILSELPLCQQLFSCVISIHIHEQTDNHDQYFSQICDLIEPGGVLAIAGLDPRSWLNYVPGLIDKYPELNTASPFQVKQILVNCNMQPIYQQACLSTPQLFKWNTTDVFDKKVSNSLGIPGLGFIMIARKNNESGLVKSTHNKNRFTQEALNNAYEAR